jgi:alanyl-tRNA synthetase
MAPVTTVTPTVAVCPTLGRGASISADLVLAGAMTDTLVTFASGATSGRGCVVHAVGLGASGPLVVVDETPFHPVDHSWPDQPGDTGHIDDQPVVDTVMAAIGPDGVLLVGANIPVRRGEPGWTWHVAHRLAEPAALPEVGTEVSLVVDPGRRRALSAAHTACHLAALAMNEASAHLWRKEVRLDSLGRPDLDQLAMESSVMDTRGSTDAYRFGKSLRKRGFDPTGFSDQLDEIVARVRRTLQEWIASEAVVVVADGGDRRVTAPRRWTCALPDGLAEMPCGGTHLRDLSTLAAVDIDYQLARDGTGLPVGLTVRSTPTLAA